MYKFTDTNQGASRSSAPSDNLLINGESLSDLVPGYRQLSVSGRGLMGESLSLTDVPLRDGTWFNYTTTEPRVLTVEFLLEADSSPGLRVQFNQLNKALRRGQDELDLTFADEPDWHYYGYLSEVGDFTEDGLSVLSNFTLLCPSSYAYRNKQSGTRVSLTYADEILPDKITITPSGGSTIELTNSKGDRLVFKGSYNAGQTVVLAYHDDHVSYTRDGQNVLTDLAMFSFPETFKLRDGDTVSVKGGRLNAIEWRDKKR